MNIFDELRSLNLPDRDYAVFGSGPLAIRGVISGSNDLDVICRGDVWRDISSRGRLEYLPDYDVSVASFFDGRVTFGTSWGIGNFDVDELIDTAEKIESLRFVRLKHVVDYKTIRSSDKDLQHLRALRQSDLPHS